MNVVQQTVELTRQLIQIPSESSDQTLTDAAAPEAAMERKLQDFADQAGLHAFRLPVNDKRNNIIIEFKGKGPRLLVVGHMDTVSARGMVDPFVAQLEGGRIRGRGACDDKGPLACALSVLAWMKTKALVPAFDLTLAATVDEECTLAGAEKLAAWIDSFDLCLALEPTQLRIVSAHKGDLRLLVRTQGKAAHSSAPAKGINAIDKMLPVIEALQRFRQTIMAQKAAHPFCGRESLSFTTIHAGSSGNIVPDDCAMTVDLRLQPGTRPEDVFQEIREILPEESSVEVLFAGAGMETDFRLPVIQELSELLRASDIAPGPVAAAFATDCCRLAGRGPCIVWGPGSIEQAHQLEEFIEIDQLAKAVRILQSFFLLQK